MLQTQSRQVIPLADLEGGVGLQTPSPPKSLSSFFRLHPLPFRTEWWENAAIRSCTPPHTHTHTHFKISRTAYDLHLHRWHFVLMSYSPNNTAIHPLWHTLQTQSRRVSPLANLEGGVGLHPFPLPLSWKTLLKMSFCHSEGRNSWTEWLKKKSREAAIPSPLKH